MSSDSLPKHVAPENSFPSTEEPTLISVTIQSQDGEQLYSKIRPDTLMRSLLRNYCSRKQFEYRAMKFFINGEFFNLNKTAAQVGLRNGDVIEAMMSQHGGGGGGGGISEDYA